MFPEQPFAFKSVYVEFAKSKSGAGILFAFALVMLDM